MAVTFTLKSSTPYELRYLVTAGGQEQGTLDAATMIADAPVGSPIAALLNTGVANDAAAVILAFENPKLLVSFPAQIRLLDRLWAIGAQANAGKLRLLCASDGIDPTGAYLIITFRHSMVR